MAAIIVALSLVVLVGFAGVALDLGKLFVAKSELQNSADACALAAVRELSGANTNQLALAEAAGIKTGASHNVLFQSNMVSLPVNDSVTFSQTLTGSYQPKSAISAADALLMKFAKCTVNRSGIGNWLVQVLNLLPGTAIGSHTVAAAAVASLAPAQTVCAIPVGVCQAKVNDPLTKKGDWLESALSPSGSKAGDLTGNFMWVDYSPPLGGAAELAGQLTGPGVCNLPAVGTPVGQAGVVSSLANDWNSRFGIYSGNVKPGESVPSYSGYAYTDVPGSWPSKFNALPNFKSQRGSNAAYQGDAATGLRTKGTILNSAALQTQGRDRRLATAAVVDCPGLQSGTTSQVTAWACVLMLHPINASGGGTGAGATRMYLEYLGKSNDANSPCATSGVPGSSTSVGPLVPALVR